MTAQVDTIASQLTMMNAGDLAQIRKLTDMLLGSNAEASQPANEDEQKVFDAMKAELETIGVHGTFYGAFSQTRNYKSWKRNVPTFVAFSKKAFKGEIKNDIHRLACYRILIKAIITDLRRREIPATSGTIANNLHRVAASFDNSFPGYLASGLAPMVARKLLSKS